MRCSKYLARRGLVVHQRNRGGKRATRVCIQVEPGRSAQLNPGDELKLGESTTYAILLGAL